jgi:hypothetical protein
MQRVWDTLQTPYRIPGFGYLSMQPEALRLSQVALQRDSLFLSLGLSARPELKTQPESNRRQLPNVSDFSQRSGFELFVAQTLPYDSLNNVLNSQLAGREFQVGKGLLKKTIRIDSARLIGGGRRAYMQVHTSKGVQGAFYLQGKPVYDATAQILSLDSLDFHVESKQVLLKSAAWVLDGTITKKLKECTRFSLAEKADSLRQALNGQMNRPIYTGVHSKGNLDRLVIEKLDALEDGIFLAGNAIGKLWIDVDAGQLISAMLR